MQKKLTELISEIIQLNSNETAITERGSLIKDVKNLINNERGKIEKKHRDGASGITISAELSTLADTLISVIYSVSCEKLRLPKESAQTFSFYASHNYSPTPNFCILALGGYGRTELQPYSDIDLLFLYKTRLSEAESIIMGNIISILWDTGFDTGHASRSVKDCVSVIRADLPSKTAVIDRRFITGDKELFKYFNSIIYDEIQKNLVDKFITEKNEETVKRHAKFSNTIFIAEPNLKEGVGGLRDYQTALWVSAARFGVNSLGGLKTRGIIDAGECATLSVALDFILRVRNELHFNTHKKEDVLLHGFQEPVAKNLGFGVDKSGVDAFMRNYFSMAEQIGRFSKEIINKSSIYKKFTRFTLLKLRKKKHGPWFESIGGQLFINGYHPDLFTKNPSLIIDLFLICQEYSLTISVSLKKTISISHQIIDPLFFENEEVSLKIKKILSGKTPGKILRFMHETGILNRVLKEIKNITYYSPRDNYHFYTVDEHTIRAIELIDELGDEKKRSELGEILKELPQKEILVIALLCHDIEKTGDPDHAERGSQLAKKIMTRWGYISGTTEVETLVKLHLLMSHTAFRRDLEDKKIIKEFCDSIKTIDQLKRLYLLTYADLKSVSPVVWTPWKGSMLKELFLRSYTFLETHEIISDSIFLERRKNEIFSKYSHLKNDLDKFLGRMPDNYIASVLLDSIPGHINLIKELKTENISIDAFSHDEFHHTELVVCAKSKPGIFFKISGALSANKITILAAQIYTRSDNIAVDSFKVQAPLLEEPSFQNLSRNIKEKMFEEFWDRVKRDIKSVLEGDIEVADLIKKRIGREKLSASLKRHIGTRIELINSVSDKYSVIEITTEDRFALLYQITDALFRNKLNIHLAKISTEGNIAIDVFYVTGLNGRKIKSKKRIDAIVQSIIQSLD